MRVIRDHRRAAPRRAQLVAHCLRVRSRRLCAPLGLICAAISIAFTGDPNCWFCRRRRRRNDKPTKRLAAAEQESTPAGRYSLAAVVICFFADAYALALVYLPSGRDDHVVADYKGRAGRRQPVRGAATNSLSLSLTCTDCAAAAAAAAARGSRLAAYLCGAPDAPATFAAARNDGNCASRARADTHRI